MPATGAHLAPLSCHRPVGGLRPAIPEVLGMAAIEG